jgi:hypothetical protein
MNRGELQKLNEAIDNVNACAAAHAKAVARAVESYAATADADAADAAALTLSAAVEKLKAARAAYEAAQGEKT